MHCCCFLEYYAIFCLYTGPSGFPNDIYIFLTSTSLTALWKPIICMKRNGPIIGYVVDFHSLENHSLYTIVTSEIYYIRDLNPYTNYFFSVAGVNVNGTGPHSNEEISQTHEDGNN